MFAVANAALLVAGGILWGSRVWLTGVIVLAMVFPLMLIRRLEDRRMRRDRSRSSRGVTRCM